MNPVVSIVMPCYNAASHLPETLASLQAQTFTDWELIASDDGSDDATLTVLAEYAARDPRLCILKADVSRTGAGSTRNRALPHAQGRWLAFLDADDTWHPEFLTRMVTALADAPPDAIAYCGWQNLGLGGDRDKPFIPPDYERADKIETWLGGCRWPIHAALVPTLAIRSVDGFDPELSSCMDYDLWLRIAIQPRLIRVPHVLAYYHHRGVGQITSNRLKIALNHWRVQLKYLAANPEVKRALGRRRVRELTLGELLKRAYVCYWKRDLVTSRALFRIVMQHGYGTLRDLKYMLPALLPETWHRSLIERLETRDRTVDGSSSP